MATMVFSVRMGARLTGVLEKETSVILLKESLAWTIQNCVATTHSGRTFPVTGSLPDLTLALAGDVQETTSNATTTGSRHGTLIPDGGAFPQPVVINQTRCSPSILLADNTIPSQ